MKIFLITSAMIIGLLIPGCTNNGGGNNGGGESALEVYGEDFGTLIINTAGKIVYLELKNNSSSPIDNLNVQNPSYPLAFDGGTFPGKSGNCSTTLASGSSCTVAFKIASWSSVGTFSQVVKLSFRTGNDTFQKDVDVRAEFRDLAKLLVSNIPFGLVNVGSSKTEKLRLHNPSSYETFKELSVKLGVGSKFVINDPTNCAQKPLPPLSTCELDVVYAPTWAAALSETVKISYKSMGKHLVETIRFDATGVDTDYISDNGSHNFGVITTQYNNPGTITLTLSRASTNLIDIKNISIGNSLTNTGLLLDPASTCTNAGMTLTGINNCTFVFKTAAPIKTDTSINQNIDINYQVGTANKKYSFTLNGLLQLDLLKLHTTSGHNFGIALVPNGGKTRITIKVQNPAASSIPAAHAFILTTKKGSIGLGSKKGGGIPLALVPALTTCTAAPLTPGNDCVFVVEASPKAAFNNFTKKLIIKYKVGTEELTLPVTVQGNFNVVAPGAGSPGIDIINSNGNNNFGPTNVVSGSAFDVTLTITNTSVADFAHNFVLDPYDNAGIAIKPWLNYFIQFSNTKSTCMTGNPIAAGGNCTVVLEITPDPTKATNLGMGRKFRLSYNDGGNNAHTQDINVTGSWNIVAAPIFPPPIAWPENTNPPLTVNSLAPADEFYSYIKRPAKPNTGLTAALLALFPQWAWNNIPGLTVTGANHMVWTFQTTPPNQLVKLKDIVPDRIVDPLTGKRYILLYHGSTSEVLVHSFATGSNSIGFDKAVITAFGMGFYMSSNANESKNYACDRRNGKAANIQPILLIIGVQEDDAIQGQRSMVDLGDALGNPNDPNIYFRRTFTGDNQFVFYSNVKPYLRIFKVIRLGKLHGMANGMVDGDGIADTVQPALDPTTSNAYKCIW
jgi:hypothetical protein